MSKKEKPIIEHPDEIAKGIELLFTTKYFSKRKLYWENFVRGMAFGAGGVIGASLLVAVLLWILSLFDTVPLIGPFFDTARESIQHQQNGR